jgi:small nuclear ribonucleoprotein (snRNP)-like protein
MYMSQVLSHGVTKTEAMDETEKNALKERFLGKLLKLTLSDNRVLLGKLECLDGDKNLI